jgi:hypothetical protein
MASDSANEAVRTGHAFWQERCRYYRGSARINIHHLVPRDDRNYTFSDKNVNRLLEIFRLEGAQRLEPEHAVPALVSEALLEEGLRRAGVERERLLRHDELNSLEFDPGVKLTVLHGQHRLRAASQFLTVTQGRWWRVELYDDGELHLTDHRSPCSHEKAFPKMFYAISPKNTLTSAPSVMVTFSATSGIISD